MNPGSQVHEGKASAGVDAQGSHGTAQPAPKARILDHIRGLDGLRALSVVAVMLYHGQVAWMHGGYLGVEVFFGISGFLITTLLMGEQETRGRVDLAGFWRRRFWRLVPALLLLLGVLLFLGGFVLGPKASQFRGDLLASFFYLENWYQIRGGSSYFADQGMPLLRHLWSLAVEGQFYVLWPFLVVLLLKLGRRWMAVVTALLLAGSATLMMVLLDPANPSSVAVLKSFNRVYLGTDTRAFGLLAGALLAMLVRGRRTGRVGGAVLDGLGILALAGLGFLCTCLEGQDLRLYQGGFLLVDALTVLVLAALVVPGTRVVRGFLGLAPLEWLGRRSYGVYLWHWPIFRLVAPGQEGLAWVALRWGLTLLVSELSFQVVEAPFRRGVKALVDRHPRMRIPLATASLAGLGAAATATVLVARQAPYVDEVQASLEANEAALDNTPAQEGLSQVLQAPPVPIPIHLPEIPRAALSGVTVTAIGDSVMKGAALALKGTGREALGDDGLLVNAEESRPFVKATELVQGYKSEGRLGDVVVIHLGTNNSSLPERHFTHLMEALSDRQLVLFLTTKSDKSSASGEVNRALAEYVKRAPNARLFDWRGAVEGHPELFYSDQTHLRPGGAKYYAAAILAQVGQLVTVMPRPAGLPPRVPKPVEPPPAPVLAKAVRPRPARPVAPPPEPVSTEPVATGLEGSRQSPGGIVAH